MTSWMVRIRSTQKQLSRGNYLSNTLPPVIRIEVMDSGFIRPLIIYMQYQLLDWDTNFFGIKVARISEPVLKESELSEILLELKIKCVKLVYWPSSREIEAKKVKQLGGVLADKKTTFAINFMSLNFEEFISTDVVEAVTRSMPLSDIESLAIQSGEYSRFIVDKKIPREKFLDLYNIWIHRSLSKEIAEEVFVIREGVKVVGMVTLGIKNGRGDIGLLAISKDYRGKQYGEKLVRASQCWFMNNGFHDGQVITQGMNKPACNLYKKCGYVIEKVEFFYHFWL